jgi:hypothetical protein
MLDDFGRGDRAQLQRRFQAQPLRLAGKEACSEQVARPRGVD